MSQNVPSFVIEELPRGSGRKVTLMGRALPYRPFTLRGTQRVEVTYYPGNPVGSGTVLGAAEGSSDISGFWKDKYLGAPVMDSTAYPFDVDGDKVSDVVEAIDIMDRIRVDGRQLQVSWGHISRYGYLKEFEQTWHNVHDCEWKMTFEWASKAEPRGNPTFPAGDDLFSIARRTAAAVNNLATDLDDDRLAFNESWRDTMARNLRKLADAQQRLEDAVERMVETVTSPLEMSRACMSSLQSMIATCKDSILYIEQTPAREWRSTADMVGNTFALANTAEVVVFQIKSDYVELYRNAAEDLKKVVKSATTDVLYTHTARAGEDVRDLSQLYFGTANDWRRIMEFNGLKDTVLTTGQIVRIPRLTENV